MDVQVGIFTQAELCQVTGLNSVTVDTWLIRGILRTTKVGGRTLRGRRQEFFPGHGAAQRGHESDGLPVALRHMPHQPLAARATAVQPHHLGVGGCRR